MIVIRLIIIILVLVACNVYGQMSNDQCCTLPSGTYCSCFWGFECSLKYNVNLTSNGICYYPNSCLENVKCSISMWIVYIGSSVLGIIAFSLITITIILCINCNKKSGYSELHEPTHYTILDNPKYKSYPMQNSKVSRSSSANPYGATYSNIN